MPVHAGEFPSELRVLSVRPKPSLIGPLHDADLVALWPLSGREAVAIHEGVHLFELAARSGKRVDRSDLLWLDVEQFRSRLLGQQIV
ncbi:hypothetical protein D9M68_949180 [compost metagenome]